MSNPPPPAAIPGSFAFAADLHLRHRVWADQPQLVGDSEVSLTAIVDWCVTHSKDLVLAGDVFNEARPPFDAVKLFADQMARMVGAGQSVFVIVGNHDPEPWALLATGVTLVDGKAFNLPAADGSFVTAYGVDYRHSSELEKLLPNVPGISRVLICHQLLDLAFPKDGSFNMRADWVPGHVKTVLIGDYHERGVWTDPRGIGFVYPGSTCLQSIAEPTDKLQTTPHAKSSTDTTDRALPGSR